MNVLEEFKGLSYEEAKALIKKKEEEYKEKHPEEYKKMMYHREHCFDNWDEEHRQFEQMIALKEDIRFDI